MFLRGFQPELVSLIYTIEFSWLDLLFFSQHLQSRVRGGSQWLETFMAHLTSDLRARTSPCFVIKNSLCCHGCVLVGIVCNEDGSEYIDPVSVGNLIYRLGLDKWCILGEKIVVAKRPLAKHFGGFAGFEVLASVLVHRLSEHASPDPVTGDMLPGVVHHDTDSPLSTKEGWPEDLPNSFLYHVWDSLQHLSDLRLKFIRSCVLQSWGHRAFFIFIFWSGFRFHLLLFNSLTIAVCITTLTGVKDFFRSVGEEASTFPFACTSYQADSLCGVTYLRMPSECRCRVVSFRRKRVDGTMAFVDSVCTITERGMGLLKMGLCPQKQILGR